VHDLMVGLNLNDRHQYDRLLEYFVIHYLIASLNLWDRVFLHTHVTFKSSPIKKRSGAPRVRVAQPAHTNAMVYKI